MPHLNQKYLTSMTWTSYGLEDLGDSYIADPDPTSCNTASNTARRGDVIRHVDDQLITLSCSNKVQLLLSFCQFPPSFRLDFAANSFHLMSIRLFHSIFNLLLLNITRVPSIQEVLYSGWLIRRLSYMGCTLVTAPRAH